MDFASAKTVRKHHQCQVRQKNIAVFFWPSSCWQLFAHLCRAHPWQPTLPRVKASGLQSMRAAPKTGLKTAVFPLPPTLWNPAIPPCAQIRSQARQIPIWSHIRPSPRKLAARFQQAWQDRSQRSNLRLSRFLLRSNSPLSSIPPSSLLQTRRQ